MPKVSVVVPNYNHERFLRARIESVLNQSYKDFEVIILDDCSTDNSREIIQQYEDNPHVAHMVFNRENSGSPFKQWNKGVRLAQGQYIWIAESDDMADERFLEEVVPVLDANPNVGIIKCQTQIIDVNGEKKHVVEDKWSERGRNWEKSIIINGKSDCIEQLLFGISIPNASGALFRKEIYIKAGYADETFKMAGDWMAWAKLLSLSDLAYVAKPLNFLREVHDNTARAKYVKSYDGLFFLEDLKVVNFIVKQCHPDKKTRLRALDKHIRRWANCFVTLERTRISFRRNIRIFREAFKISKMTPLILLKHLLLRPFRAINKRM